MVLATHHIGKMTHSLDLSGSFTNNGALGNLSIVGSGVNQYAYISAYSASTNTLSWIYLKTVPLNFKRFFTFPFGALGANPIGAFNSVNKCYYFMSTTIPQFAFTRIRIVAVLLKQALPSSRKV